MKRAIISEIARNPLLGSMLIGVAVNLLEIPVPTFLLQAALFLGDGALPLLLLSIGASLRFSAIRSNAVALTLAIMRKILVFPMALVSIGLFVGLDPLALAVLAAVGAAPTASSTFTLASELGGDAQLMAEIVSLQTAGGCVVAAALDMACRRCGGTLRRRTFTFREIYRTANWPLSLTGAINFGIYMARKAPRASSASRTSTSPLCSRISSNRSSGDSETMCEARSRRLRQRCLSR